MARKKQKAAQQPAANNNRQDGDRQPKKVTAASPRPWSARTRTILSILAVLHLFAVFSAPWAMPQPSSQLARDVNEVTSFWTHALYMRHGYRFFAPDPGPSHLIWYEVTTEEGETKTGRFPDQQVHRPRLLYHRFFMISEHFWGLGVSEGFSNEDEREELIRSAEHLRENGFVQQADWLLQNLPRDESSPPSDEEIQSIVDDLKRQGNPNAAATAQRNLKEQQKGMRDSSKHRKVWLEGIANYLKKKHQATSVRIWIQEHMIPTYDHMLDGGKLNDPENFGPRQLVYSEDEVIQ